MTTWYVTDGAEVKPITKAKVREWIKRTREDLRFIEHALASNDVGTFVEFAHDASGSAAELENVADTTAGHQ